GDPARRHGIHPHAGVAPFVGGGLGEVLHAGTGRAGVAHARHAAPHVSEHIDDAAAVLALAEQEHVLGHQEPTDQVGADHGFKPFLVDADQRGRELAAGVVHQMMNAAAFGEHGFDHGLHGVFVADVADMEADVAAIFEDL